MKNICLSFFIILITILHANEELKSQIDMDYHLHLYSISRLSDGGVVKIPFRLGDVDFAYYNEDIKISSRLSLEYKPKFSDFYFDANYPQEFSIDLRELYLTWYFDNAELRVGKQIHTWGSVDQNSPLDNASPYDYYYIFSIGKEQKMGSFSGAFDYYFGNSTLGIVFSPIHHTNRLPLGNDDFPIELPVIPRSIQMQEVENEFEYGAYLKHSFDRSDITLSYYKGNDRVYNLSGINVYTPAANSVNPANLDSIFTHRKTEILGLGTSVVTDFVTIRADYGKFYTYDPNSDYSDRIRLDKLEGKKAIFKDGTEQNADVVILCTGYLHHFPFLDESLKLKTHNRLYPPKLYKGVVWQDNHKLLYLGMQDQFHTFNMFDCQGWYARDVIMGKIKMPSSDEIDKDINKWVSMEEKLENPDQMIDFQTEYTKELHDMSDYPKIDFELIRKHFKEWEHHKVEDILTYRNKSFSSPVTGSVAPIHHTPWEKAMDDSMKTFLNK